jgi:hypothetical protein
MHIWTILIGVFLVLLKSGLKLFLVREPDLIDYLKAMAVLPVDVAFLIIALLIKYLTGKPPNVEQTVCYFLGYLVASLVITVLWSYSEKAIQKGMFGRFGIFFPFNLALSGAAFYLAITLLN